MEYKIRNVLESPIMKDAKVVAGESGLSNTVSDIIIMEAHDVEKWLKPDQLILTSLFSLQNSTEEECISFIRHMADLGASGLIVKLGRFVDEIPNGIILGAKQYNIPVILIGASIEYRDIVLEVMQNVLNRKAEMLDLFQNVHHEFKNLSLKEAPIKEVLFALKRLIKADVSLEDNNRVAIETTLSKADIFKVLNSRHLFKETYMTYEYVRELIEVEGELASQLVVKIDLENQDYKYLVIKELEQFVLMQDYMAIENACSSIQFEYAKKLALSKVKQSHMNDLVDQIINGKYQSNEELLELGHTLHLSNNKNYRVITWMHRPDVVGSKMSFNEREKLLLNYQSIINELESIWPRFAYRIFSNRLTFIIEDNFKSDFEFKRYISDSLEKLNSKRVSKLTMKVGISEKGDIADVSKNAIQPLKVIQIAQVRNIDEFVMLYDDLGVYKLFLDLKNSFDLNSYVRDDLINMDENNRQTLRVFLDKNQNYKHTSEVLFVHPKTVKYRIGKMIEVNKFDFNDPNEMFQLMLELRILDLSKI